MILTAKLLLGYSYPKVSDLKLETSVISHLLVLVHRLTWSGTDVVRRVAISSEGSIGHKSISKLFCEMVSGSLSNSLSGSLRRSHFFWSSFPGQWKGRKGERGEEGEKEKWGKRKEEETLVRTERKKKKREEEGKRWREATITLLPQKWHFMASVGFCWFIDRLWGKVECISLRDHLESFWRLASWEASVT